ncbi:hypothetical protein J6590_101899 [Homalodisca vitripennis]|nr:hypothetical protein J6590_101899 [Homalodisca vitripennis]
MKKLLVWADRHLTCRQKKTLTMDLIKTLQKISPQNITKLVEKKQSGATTYKDNRGGPKNSKYTFKDRLMVRAHVNLFPRDSAKKQLELHHRKTEAAFTMLKSDTAKSTMLESDTLCVVMDLQKVFSFPNLSHSDMYYSRQVSCYNFGLHVSDTGNAIMCVWHEGMFYEVEQKFLISVHSFSSADRDFALIEKTAKHSKMESVEDVKKVIERTRPSKPFKFLDMTDKPVSAAQTSQAHNPGPHNIITDSYEDNDYDVGDGTSWTDITGQNDEGNRHNFVFPGSDWPKKLPS